MSNRMINLLNELIPNKGILSLKPVFGSMPSGEISQCLGIITEWLRLHSEEVEVLLSVILESESTVSIKHICLVELNQFLSSNSSAQVKNCQIVAVYHRCHSMSEVVRNLPMEILPKSQPFRSVKINSCEVQFAAQIKSSQMPEPFVKKEEKKTKNIPLGKKKSQKKEQAVLTSYPQARHDLEKKVQSKEEEKRKLKMTLESDEQYYDKHAFSKVLQADDEKAKETDSSGKKMNGTLETEQDPEVAAKKLDFKCEDDDEEDLFAQMNEIAKKKEIKTESKKSFSSNGPPAKKSVVSKPVSQTGPKNNLMGWLSKK